MKTRYWQQEANPDDSVFPAQEGNDVIHANTSREGNDVIRANTSDKAIIHKYLTRNKN